MNIKRRVNTIIYVKKFAHPIYYGFFAFIVRDNKILSDFI